jgi:hypothetical protein
VSAAGAIFLGVGLLSLLWRGVSGRFPVDQVARELAAEIKVRQSA